MSRYERSSGPTRLYVGRLSRHVRSRDLEDMFGKYGRVRAVDMKYDFAFVDFGDHQDADDARHYLNGREVSGNRIIVEFAKGAPRGGGGGGGGGGSSQEYLGRGPPPGTGRCYNCGNDGHWARDCKAGDWKNKCYKCGQRGHIERDCRGSAKVSSRHDDRDGSRSRSRSRSREREGGEHRGRSYHGRERSYSRSPPKRGCSRSSSPPPRKASGNNRSPDASPPSERRRLESQSPPQSLSRSPVRTKGSPPLGSRSRSRSPSENGQNSASSSPRNMSQNRSRSPLSDEPRSPNGVDRGPLTDEADLQRSPNGVDRDSSRSND